MAKKKIPCKEIKEVPGLNPPRRILGKTFKGLLDSIKEKGILVPLLINQDGLLVDGYRRFNCAKELGIEKVPVEVLHGDPAELWSTINGSMRAVHGRDWMWVAAYGAPVKNQTFRSQLKILRSVIGNSGICKLAKANISPHVVRIAQTVSEYCRESGKKFLQKTIWWLVDQKGQNYVRQAMRSGIPAEVLCNAINKGKALWESAELTGGVGGGGKP